MIVEKNFLTGDEQDKIDNQIVYGQFFPWYRMPYSSSMDYPFYGHVLATRQDKNENIISDPIMSDWYWFFKPIFERFINKHEIFKGKYTVLRACLNDSLSFEDEFCDPHVDYDEPHTILILYLTDSSGATIIYDKKLQEGESTVYLNKDGDSGLKVEHEVEPERGKMMCFDGLKFHSVRFKQDDERRIICIFAVKGELNGMVL